MTAGHLLVVDDEKAQRDILTVILEGEGYTVETASNVSQALSAYRNHPADVAGQAGGPGRVADHDRARL